MKLINLVAASAAVLACGLCFADPSAGQVSPSSSNPSAGQVNPSAGNPSAGQTNPSSGSTIPPVNSSGPGAGGTDTDDSMDSSD